MTSNPLVSIIIPCFNAEKWLKETVEHCFQQSYGNIEIIIIDDGSKDGSLEIIKSFGDKVIWQTGPNCGGCHARNQGFSLAKGDYIQFLDADDVILPDKIKCQVEYLESSSADVVYSDWRYIYSLPDNNSTLSDIEIAGAHSDMLEYFLRDKSWIALSAYLFRRSVVINSQGWDEQLCAGQDRDFLLSVALTGANFAYLPGCYSFYRRHSTNTVSTANQARWLEGHFLLMRKVEGKLVQSEKFTEKYKQALAASYFDKATSWCLFLTSNQYFHILKHAYDLDPNVAANSPMFQALKSAFGFLPVAASFYRLKQVRHFGRAKKYNPFQLS